MKDVLMSVRLSSSLLVFGGSVLLLAGLIAVLYWPDESRPSKHVGEPLHVYCAEALRPPLELIAKDYESEAGQRVILDFGASQTMLATLTFSRQGDLFLPADDSYVRLAEKASLVKEVFDLARMQAVLVVRPHLPKKIASWDDLLATGAKIGLANPEAAAIGKLLKQGLQAQGLWDTLAGHDPIYMGNVAEVANSARLGSIDAGIVWDVIALRQPELKIVRLKELANVQAEVQIALTTCSKQPDAARRFVHFIRATDKGAAYLKKLGYTPSEP